MKCAVLAVLAGITFSATPALAEFHCSAEVHYMWLPRADAHQVAVTPDASNPSVTPAPGETAAPKGRRKVFWRLLEAKGASEDDAKRKLNEGVLKERTAAENRCAEAHENQSNCLAAKFNQHNAALTMMSFTQRKEFEQKMVSDCEHASGACAGSQSSEPACHEIVVTPEGGTEKGKGDSKAKDAKKK